MFGSIMLMLITWIIDKSQSVGAAAGNDEIFAWVLTFVFGQLALVCRTSHLHMMHALDRDPGAAILLFQWVRSTDDILFLQPGVCWDFIRARMPPGIRAQLAATPDREMHNAAAVASTMYKRKSRRPRRKHIPKTPTFIITYYPQFKLQGDWFAWWQRSSSFTEQRSIKLPPHLRQARPSMLFTVSPLYPWQSKQWKSGSLRLQRTTSATQLQEMPVPHRTLSESCLNLE